MKNHCQKPWITWVCIWPAKAIASQSSQNIYRLTSLIRIQPKLFDSSQLYTNITASINRSITNRPIRHHTDSMLFTRISLDRDIPISRNQRKNIVTHANNSLFTALYLIVHLKYLRPVNTRWLQNEHQHHVLTFFTGLGRALWTCSCLLHPGPSDLLDGSEPVKPKKPPLNGAASRPRQSPSPSRICTTCWCDVGIIHLTPQMWWVTTVT